MCTQATPALVELEGREAGRQVRCFLHSSATVDEVAVTVGAKR